MNYGVIRSRIRHCTVCSLALAVIGTLALAAAQAGPADPLTALQGKKRVLLVFAPSPHDARFLRQKRGFTASSSGAQDRDLTEIDIVGNGNRVLRQRYHVAANALRVLLIGKDGHVACSVSHPITAGDLFRRIDRMPMRRDEMRHRRLR